MAKNPPPPELVEAYQLIKAGNKVEAGRILKEYLTHTKDDVQAWWLMSHVANNPDTVRRCLEMVLKLDPGHEKARTQLVKITGQAPSDEADQLAPKPMRPSAPRPSAPRPSAPRPSAPRASAPRPVQLPTPKRDNDDFPSDDMVLAGLTARAAPAKSTPSPALALKQDVSFEDFLQSDQAADPFAGPPVDDPFTSIPPAADPFAADPFAIDPFAPVGVTSDEAAASDQPASYDPFAAKNVFDPSAGVQLGQQTTAQAAGTGNQPDWGPGLAFMTDSSPALGGAPDLGTGLSAERRSSAERASVPRPKGGPTPILVDEDLRVVRRARTNPNTILIAIGGLVATLILVGLLYFVIKTLNERERVPSMTTLDAAAFTIDYPKGWDHRCETEQQGYPVCGMANHRLYNEVDYFAGTDINLGSMFGELFGAAFTGENLPDEAVSIIAMDVPRTSRAYDDASWAKTLHEWNFGENPTYNKKTMEIDGYEAYYYEFISRGKTFTWAAWDVYILHDNVVFWLRIDYSGDGKKTVPKKMVTKMIKSIDIK